jgi:CheY-like chemotaxis protein
MAGKKKYDIILMDINLIGRLNGFETTHEIKKIKGYEKTPIIAVTAHAKIGDKEKILLEGLTHYISKPFLKSEFLSLLNEALIAVPSP